VQGESAATAGYHSANAAVGQTEDQLAKSTIGALANLATATAADRGVVAALTEANVRLVKQLEDNSNELRELKVLIKKEIVENVKLLPIPQPPLCAPMDARTNPSAQRATQLRSVLARVYAVARQNQINTTVP
jgi:hypothetical protein